MQGRSTTRSTQPAGDGAGAESPTCARRLRRPGRVRLRLLAPIALALAAVSAAAAPAADRLSLTDRIVVQLRPGVRLQDLGEPAFRALGVARGAVRMRALGAATAGGPSTVVVQLPVETGTVQAADIARRVAADPRVRWAEPDRRVRLDQVAVRGPTADPQSAAQWNLAALAGGGAPGTAHVHPAWTIATGAGVVVALVDTGRVAHPDLDGRWLPGHDFVADLTAAADGDGRDTDPTDPGDACTGGDRSTWHGLAMAGLVASVPDNGIGIAGAAPAARVLPVRALGRCGGWMSDVADALRWAAGLPVAGAPSNAHPARVVNLSLSTAPGTACGPLMQDAVDAVRRRGVVVVASAGNDGVGDLGAPATCDGVVVVGAHVHGGDLARYSNRGTGVALTAPGGGDCATPTAPCRTDPLPTLRDRGPVRAEGPLDGAAIIGTSAAAAQVSAVVALLLQARPDLTPDEVRAVLRTSARPHPAGTACAATDAGCGAGMVDALAAVRAAARTAPLALAVDAPRRPSLPGTAVTATARASGGVPPYAYRWHDAGDPAMTAALSPGPDTTVVLPRSKRPGTAAERLLEAVVTDATGDEARDLVALHVDTPPTATPPGVVVAPCGSCEVTVVLGGTDADGDAVRHRVLDAPGPFSVDDASGTARLSGPPGDHAVRYTVVTAEAESPVYTFTLSVAPALRDVSAAAPAPATTASPVPPAPGSAVGASTAAAGAGGGATSPVLLLALAAAARTLRRRTARQGLSDGGAP